MNSFMRNRYINNSNTDRCKWLFPLFNILAFIAAYVYNIRAGAMACIIILGYYVIDRRFLAAFGDVLFCTYLLINIFSVYAYFTNGRPLLLYLTCISYNLIPMLLFGFGYILQDAEENQSVFRTLCKSNVIIVSIGLIVYLIPGLASMLGKYSIATAGIDAKGIGYRFDSYLDSLTMGSLCAINVPLVMLYRFRKKYTRAIFLIITAIGLFLTLQRGAWVIAFLGLIGSLAINVILKKKNGIKEFIKYLILIVLLFAALFYFATHFLSQGMMQHLMIRLSRLDFTSMMSDRNYQISNGFKTFFDYPLGFGLGAAGIKAANYGMQVVPDGNLLKILVETGVLGFATFIALNIRAIVYGLMNRKYYSVLIIILFLGHSIGSNVLDFYYSSFIYWYILGYLSGSRNTHFVGCSRRNKH